ncbi:MAG: hypothetical protein U9N57_01320 [Pseudomonadota bacterium]|nr:hypothetical protein [Pseudomonadota bacterium]
MNDNDNKKKKQSREKEDLDLFRQNAYLEEHSTVLRKKNLPEELQHYTIFTPTSLIHSNLFLFDTKNRKWMFRDFPIISRWMSKDYSLSYTGEALNVFDMKVMMHLIKSMESRTKPNESLFNSYIEQVLANDTAFNSMGDDGQVKQNYKNSILRRNEKLEGVFLKFSEFRHTVGIHGGGQNQKMIMDSIRRMENGILKIKTHFTNGRKNFETSSQLITPLFLPDTNSCYITFSPMIFDLFRYKTSQINSRIMININSSNKNKSTVDPAIFSMMCTYARGDKALHQIELSSFLIKSPYFLLDEQQNGVFGDGRIINVESGSQVGKGLTENQVKTAIRKSRKHIIDSFKNMEELGILKHQVRGRGKNTKIVFQLEQKFETIAEQKIRSRDHKALYSETDETEDE